MSFMGLMSLIGLMSLMGLMGNLGDMGELGYHNLIYNFKFQISNLKSQIF